MKQQLQTKLLRPIMPELDTLRGVAILAVVFYHGFPRSDAAPFFSGIVRIIRAIAEMGWLGVNLFFVLSGFLITGILLDSKGGPQYYKRFYVRRALRIVPAYLLLLLLLLVLPRMGIVDRRISWSFVGLSLIYLSNFTNFFGVAMQYGPLWSLAVEEQFYLVWPAAVRNLSQRALALCALAVFLLCPLLRAVAFALGHSAEVWYTWMVADGLASGCILAIFIRTVLAERRSMKWFAALFVTSSLLLIGFGSRFGTLSPNPPTTLLGASLRWTLFNILFMGMLGWALLLGTGPWARIVQLPTLQFFGKISYGLYLIHTLVFDVTRHFVTPASMHIGWFAVGGSFSLTLLRFLIGAVAATLLAFLSRRYFEDPFLKLKDRWTAPGPDPTPQRNQVQLQPGIQTIHVEA